MKIQPFQTVVLPTCAWLFYWALQSSQNICYGSINDLFALYRCCDTVDLKECDFL